MQKFIYFYQFPFLPFTTSYGANAELTKINEDSFHIIYNRNETDREYDILGDRKTTIKFFIVKYFFPIILLFFTIGVDFLKLDISIIVVVLASIFFMLFKNIDIVTKFTIILLGGSIYFSFINFDLILIFFKYVLLFCIAIEFIFDTAFRKTFALLENGQIITYCYYEKGIK
ncbi:hypothetical protein [Campylobacter sp. RM12651]|uniref:hypothetical protein n=1 Tax=Campylobacter sp. RM12651 TaxID=1660079 RepID=UPI001EFBA379|nr:hypothetical protein [Campylobacter sp. RM12651]ULO04504.1 putative membrane protein [Campylobacter sp. RM12651]